ncbi:hypothetical protein GWI72_00945 [Microvirga tunisiensis]|uniref:Uncharacterized protein n=1 Tax=Pannonibacter tanglangensis TaxID=2750084 RepID=A0A7X5J848_9HYPH|nr:hypothetical protein [Pannonibacter sp. XCT-53]NBN76830.1 hypothetical protein [Pannonibacter sp. XCT-53]
MTERFSTTAAAAISPPWSPSGDVVLQADCADPRALVDIEGRVNDAAPWLPLVTLSRQGQRQARLARMPQMRVSVRENGAGQAVRVFEEVALTSVAATNVVGKFREAFETFSGERWQLDLAAGDIVTVDGNAISASYLVVSKDPLSSGTETVVTGRTLFTMPYDLAYGLHMSQRAVGLEAAIEVVSDEAPLPEAPDLPIASISQAGTVLTITTTVPHGLVPGKRIGICDVADSRLNYAGLVVATAPTATTLTVTAGVMGTLPSLTAGPLTGGSVYQRPGMGRAQNGVALVYEGASQTSASVYLRSASGDLLPSGTVNGDQRITTGSTTSQAPINAARTYAFLPSVETRIVARVDSVQISDVGADSSSQAANRSRRSQVIPDETRNYKVRLRAHTNKSHTRPVAQIVSAVKSGSATATIVTDQPHGLNASSQVVILGIADAVNFPALAAPTTVASVVNSTTFTVAIGASATATSHGGYVALAQGGQGQAGGVAQSIISVARAENVVTLTGSASWSGLVHGDYVNVVGCRRTTAPLGASVGVDGAYRVREINGATLILEQINADVSPGGGDISAIACGGAVIKRSDVRLSFLRLIDFERLRVEALPRPGGDSSDAFPVTCQSGSVAVAGTVAEDASAGSVNPVQIGVRARSSNPSPMSASGDAVHALATMIGALVVKPYSIADAEWSMSIALTSTTAQTIQGAAGSGLRRHLTAIQAINTGAASVDLIILDGTTERWRMPLPVNVPVSVQLPTGLQVSTNTALNVNLGAAGTVRFNAQGYTAT